MPPPEDGFVAAQQRRHQRQASLNIISLTAPTPENPPPVPLRRRSSTTVFPVSLFLIFFYSCFDIFDFKSSRQSKQNHLHLLYRVPESDIDANQVSLHHMRRKIFHETADNLVR